MNRLLYKIKSLFINQQRWLTRLIPRSKIDKCDLLSILILETLINFVDKDQGLLIYEVTNDYQRKQYDDLYEAYIYAKYDRPYYLRNVISTIELTELLEELDIKYCTSIIKHHNILWT